MSLSPKISVVIPTYNRTWLLRRAVQSVLSQTYQALEILVVDDGSDFDTAEVLRDLTDTRLRVLRHEANLGAAAARNTGIRAATGQYVCFLDSDDEWLSDKVERQLEFLTARSPKARLCCTAFALKKDRDGPPEIRHSPPVIRYGELYNGCRLSPGTTLMAQRDLFEEIGVFDESLRRLEDWDWLLRCVQHTPIFVQDDVLAIIYYSKRSIPKYEIVRSSCMRFLMKHVNNIEETNNLSKRVFTSAVHLEIAASAYRDRRIWQSIFNGAKSLAANPLRGSEFYRRIVSQMIKDVRMHKSQAGIHSNLELDDHSEYRG